MRLALDTNILAYAEGVNGAERRALAQAMLQDLADDELIVPAQVLAELFAVLTRKARQTAAVARTRVLSWSDAYECMAVDASVVADAMELNAAHRIGWWDSLVVASASAAGCRVLLSEDMSDGFTWRGLSLRNPFADAEN